MKHALSISSHNIQPHLDIEDDIKLRGNGLLTFTIRVNNGNIVDYNLTEYVDVKQKYLRLKSLVIQQLGVTRNNRE